MGDQFVWKQGGGQFNDANQWQDLSTGANPAPNPPSGGDTASFTTGGGGVAGSGSVATLNFSALTTYQITGSISAGAVTTAGNTSLTGTLQATGTASGLQQSGGQFAVQGGGQLTATSIQQIGGGGTLSESAGARIIVTGGQNSTPGNGPIGVVITSAANVTGGSLDSSAGFIAVGQSGTGTPATFTVQNGGTVRAAYTVLGSYPQSYGTLSLQGQGTTWSDVGSPGTGAGGSILVGFSGNGSPPTDSGSPAKGSAQLAVSTGATLNESGSASIGDLGNSVGAATITSNGTWTIGTTLAVGRLGTGSLTVGTNSSVKSKGPHIAGTPTVVLGSQAGSKGTALVGGTGAVLDSGGDQISVGRFGSGSLTVNQGGAVRAGTTNTSDSALVIGGGTSGSGIVVVSDTGSSLIASGEADVGVSGNGTLTVQNGATFTAKAMLIGALAGGVGNVLVSGAQSSFNVSSLALGGSSSVVGGSGSLSATGGAVVAIANSVVLWPTASLSADGTSSITIGAGASPTQGAISIGSGGSLTGSGTITGPVIDNSLIQAQSGTLVIGGAVSGTGTLGISTNSVLRVAGSIGNGNTIVFGTGTNEVLDLTNASTNSAAVTGFSQGDTLHFGGLVFNSASYSNGVLSLTASGTPVSSFAITGAPTNVIYNVTPDGAGGSSVTIGGTSVDTTGYPTRIASVINGALAGLVAKDGSLNTSTSTTGAQLFYPVANHTNIAIVSNPTPNGTISLPNGDQGVVVQGTAPTTVIDSSAGGNLLVANDGNDIVQGTGSGDTLVGGAGGTVLFGGSNNTLLVGGTGANVLVAGAGVTTSILNGNGSAAYGGTGQFFATDFGRGDFVIAGSGQTVVFGAGSNSTYFLGKSGQDIAVMGTAFNTVVTGAGASVIFDGTAGGSYFGGPAAMLFVGGTAASTVVGGTAANTLFGGPGGSITYFGSSNGNVFVAGSGNETLNAGGASGNNVFFGGIGADVFTGGQGTDIFVAATGAETINTGAGRDLISFVNGAAGSTYNINGFNFAGGQRLALRGYAANQVQTALANATNGGSGLTLTLADNTRITLNGVTSLTSNAFI